MGFNKKQHLQTNIDALRIAFKLEKENRQASVGERLLMMQYEGTIKYTYNNGIIAKDPQTATMNFLNALEKLPGYIEQEQKKIIELKKDLPILQEVVNSTWSKENRLNELKTELAAADRKIQLSITPESKDQGDAKKIADELKNIQEKAPLRLRTM